MCQALGGVGGEAAVDTVVVIEEDSVVEEVTALILGLVAGEY